MLGHARLVRRLLGGQRHALRNARLKVLRGRVGALQTPVSAHIFKRTIDPMNFDTYFHQEPNANMPFP
jgi:hypothetical protein